MTLENPAYYSGHAPPRSRGPFSETRWGWEVGMGGGASLRSQKEPESRSWARPRRPAELGEDPGPLRVLRGPLWAASPGTRHRRQSRPGAAAPPPAAGQGASGKGAVRREKTFVSRAHTPRSRKTPLRLASGPHRGTWRAPRLRKGRDSEPTLGAGEDSGPEAPGRVSAPRPAAPLPSPRPGGARGSSRFGETCCSRVRRLGSAGRGRPLVPGAGHCCPQRPCGGRSLFPRGLGKGHPCLQDWAPGKTDISKGQEESIPGVMLKKEPPQRGPCECPALRCCPPVLLERDVFFILLKEAGTSSRVPPGVHQPQCGGSQFSPGNVDLGPLYLPPALHTPPRLAGAAEVQ